MKVLTIQDMSCYGQCSITVALPILSSRGIETAVLPSAILSTHTTGFEGFEIFDFTEPMKKIVDHWIREEIRFDGIYTGYIANPNQFELILECKRSFLKEDGVFIVDPAMADHGKLYPGLGEEIVRGMRSLCREADIILPNITEACLLAGVEYREDFDIDEIDELAQELSRLGPKYVIITGIEENYYDHPESDEEKNKKMIGALIYESGTDEMDALFTEKLRDFHGTGDVFSSFFTAEYLLTRDVQYALQQAMHLVVRSIKKTIPDQEHTYGVKFEEVLLEERDNNREENFLA